MKARETVGKLVSMFGKPQPVGNFHFSTKDSNNRPEGEPPLYYGILRTVFNPRKNFKGFKSAWVYWIATFDPNNIDGTAINTTVPYLDEEKAIRAYKDVFDRYYPEANDIEYGCKDWSALGENKKGTVTLSESQLRTLVAESVKKVLKEMETPTPYGPMTSGDWKPTFDDPKQQEEFSSDVIDMLSKIPDERFVNLYWNRRLTFNDPNTVDAIYKEAIKRGLFDNPAL